MDQKRAEKRAEKRAACWAEKRALASVATKAAMMVGRMVA